MVHFPNTSFANAEKQKLAFHYSVLRKPHPLKTALLRGHPGDPAPGKVGAQDVLSKWPWRGVAQAALRMGVPPVVGIQAAWKRVLCCQRWALRPPPPAPRACSGGRAQAPPPPRPGARAPPGGAAVPAVVGALRLDAAALGALVDHLSGLQLQALHVLFSSVSFGYRPLRFNDNVF